MKPILHHYDASPFSRKAQKMLGLKQLSWLSVEMPMTAPKPEIEELTGGYRGTPVLQLGHNFFVDNLAIAQALDRCFPETKTLAGKHSRFIDDAIGHWADELFEPVLRAAVGKFAADWDDHFRADRQAVFPHLDFDRLPGELPNFYQRIVTMAQELAAHLESFGPFIHGAEPSLADIHCWGILWFVFAGLPEVSEPLQSVTTLHEWYAAMEAVGFGERIESNYEAAYGVVTASQLEAPLLLSDSATAFGDWIGSEVSVRAEGADRGVVNGILSAVDADLIRLSVSQTNDQSTHVYFPRMGYSLTLI